MRTARLLTVSQHALYRGRGEYPNMHWAGGCIPACTGRGMSAQGVCLPGGCLPGGYMPGEGGVCLGGVAGGNKVTTLGLIVQRCRIIWLLESQQNIKMKLYLLASVNHTVAHEIIHQYLAHSFAAVLE